MVKQQTSFMACLPVHFTQPSVDQQESLNKRQHLIDNIITNMHEYPVTSGILYNDISDHFPVFNFYSMERSKGEKYTTVY